MAAAILAGCLIAIGAWGARNAIVVGTFVTGSTHDGKTLFESVYRTARPEIVRTGVAQDFDPAEAPMLAEAVGLGEAAVDRFYRREALAYMAAHPGDVGRTALFKLAVSLTGIDLGHPLTSARNVVAAGFNLILIVLAGWGWRRWWRAESERGGREAAMRAVLGSAALILTVSTVVLLALGPVGLRYRISFSGLLYVGVAMLTVPRRHPPELASPASPHPAHLPG